MTFGSPLDVGRYRLDVLATWLRGDTEPKTPHYEVQELKRNVGYEGDEFHWQTAGGKSTPLKRGSPFMLCAATGASATERKRGFLRSPSLPFSRVFGASRLGALDLEGS